MREVWQRRPFLMRGAFHDFDVPVGRDRLFAMARDPLIKSPRRRPAVTGRCAADRSRGCHRRGAAAGLAGAGCQPHDEAAHRLLGRFRFVPEARLDDLMVSFASDGGGVGPHVDSYDVFLLQAAGRRRWRISRQRDLRFRDDVPLQLLKDFRAKQEWELEPGDMLYLPPGVAHEGVAVGESLTYSIGFRAPTYQELLEPWLGLRESATVAGRYADPGIAGHIDARRCPRDDARIHARCRGPGQAAPIPGFLLRRLTEPKANIVFRRPRRPLSLASFPPYACSEASASTGARA
jgi:50S ribosomal protein L16 3-hydroxylase